MRWLHLSDLHIGRDNSAQKLAINSLVDAIAKNSTESVDLVLLTGDLAYSGHAEEYKRLQQYLIEPLRKLECFSEARFVAAPGNHDLDCSQGLPISWDSLGAHRQQEFFAKSDAGKKLRAARARAFEEYESFASRCSIETCIPTEGPISKFTVIGKSGIAIELISVNTAYFSDHAVKDNGLAPAPVDALRGVLATLDKRNPVFVIGHHPINWFIRETTYHFQTLLVEQNAVYLHGHMHEIDPHFGQKGLMSLGFGAAYLGPLSSPSKPYYRNTFALCELADALKIRFVSWDNDYGSWIKEARIPPSLMGREGQEDGSFLIKLPTSTVGQLGVGSARQQALSSVSVKLQVTPPIWLDAEPKAGWLNLLTQLGELSSVSNAVALTSPSSGSGAVELIVDDANDKRLVRAFAAASSTVTYAEIEQTNTLLDTESLTSCIVVTFGTLASDAETLAARLRTKKKLLVLTGADIAEKTSKLQVVERIRSQRLFEIEKVYLTPLVTARGIAVVVCDSVSRSWFCLFDVDATLASESAELTYLARKAMPELTDMPYWKGSLLASIDSAVQSTFARRAYLDRSTEIFDTVKYAGLAALGFRMPVDSLRQLYVPAAADVSANQASRQALKTAVDEFVDALKLDTLQRDQLETQLRHFYGLNKGAEAGAAADLYQKYGALLVVGDPGSGKSCFVRSQILTYCQPPSEESGWYTKHTPVFLPLADAAKATERGDHLLDVCVQFAASQKLQIDRRQLDILMARGEVAFFFDGVDEVGSLEIRHKLLQQISELIEQHQHKGNRFVLTSRPAAVNNAQIPEELVRIRLRGLTTEEIRILATRIMSFGPSEKNRPSESAADRKEIVDQLVRDCEEKPGIRRLARNPLLLTLLVLIYANSGAIAARRHVVYSQAVKTLVSVRHRSKKSHVLSEADLRRRLGELAIAVYRGVVSEIPSRKEIRGVLCGSPDFASASSPSESVDAFIHDVAETTGLVVIHPRSESSEDDVVSFMHHSFLEYYAAIGFMKEQNYIEAAPMVALAPRWREVVTLMFGLLGEQGDISDFLVQIAKYVESSDRITASRLSLALDCALECDVPPQRAQDLLATELSESLSRGVASVVAETRAILAPKVQELLLNTGSASIRKALVDGIASADPRTSASHIDFVSRMELYLSEDAELRQSISAAFLRDQEVVRIACLAALQDVSLLRMDANLDQVRHSLDRGSVLEKLEALRLIETEPSLASRYSQSVLDCLKSKNKLIANLAARCVLIGGLFVENGFDNKELLGRALAIHTQNDGPQKKLDKFIDIPTERLEGLIYSKTPEDQKLGIRSLVVMQREPGMAHNYLLSILKSSDNHDVRSACLDALAMDSRLVSLATLADTELICRCTEDGHMDVRRSAARALRHFPTIDFVRDTLRRRYEALRDTKDGNERSEIIRSLATHGIRDRGIKSFLQDELVKTLLRDVARWGEGRYQLARNLLNACGQVGATLDAKGSTVLFDTISDFRTPAEVRRIGIRIYGRICEQSMENAKRIQMFLDGQPWAERVAAYRSVASFVERCKGSIKMVRELRTALDSLKQTLIAKWDVVLRDVDDRIDAAALRDIRSALLSIEEIVTSYDEFASRMKVSEYERQATLELIQLE